MSPDDFFWCSGVIAWIYLTWRLGVAVKRLFSQIGTLPRRLRWALLGPSKRSVSRRSRSR